MRALSTALRKQLETAVLTARRASESASRAAIEGLGVFAEPRPGHLKDDQVRLRIALRAKWRQLGGGDDAKSLLVTECAYEQWHRLLFARFLAENQLLLHPQYKAAVTLADCEELATELGEPDGWSVAARFAAEILPGIFRLDDPCVQLRLAPEGRHALEQILDSLPAEMFIADDSLGWVYQFWQKDKKDEVNASERKIEGADIGPVTQLFTENYMVRFLLENSLGAWWAARHPDSPLVKGFDFLRFDDDAKPSAGTFDAWPAHVADVTVIDPCCGSGHFLVQAFSMLWQMRVEEDGVAPTDAQDAVLRDNLFGLELDPRCVQIAMFAVALQAWKADGRWRQLPIPNIACSGIPVKASVEEWKALADGDARLENALVRLHHLFRDADTLGSLIEPRRTAQTTGVQPSLDDVAWHEVAPLLMRAAQMEGDDPSTAVLGESAAATARAADSLSREYDLVVTNVPYLVRGKQGPLLRELAESHFRDARPDLATVFLERCWSLLKGSGVSASVTPQNWLYLGSYEDYRRGVLRESTWNLLARIGLGATSTKSWDTLRALLIATKSRVMVARDTLVVDAFTPDDVGREEDLRCGSLRSFDQLGQLLNPLAIVTTDQHTTIASLGEFAITHQGMKTGDDGRFRRNFWEVAAVAAPWRYLQGTVSDTMDVGGCESIVHWENGGARLAAGLKGQPAWGRAGVAVSLMRGLPVARYYGDAYDSNVGALVPKNAGHLRALWAFASSADFNEEVRKVDPKLGVANASLLRVPFDIDRWEKVAERAVPRPEPSTDDPTQWLFTGQPVMSSAPLPVAVARLVGYRWPEQPEADNLDVLVDSDGIVCLPSVAGESPAADRVTQLLAAAYGGEWSPPRVKELLEQAGSKKKNLNDWLQDEYFKHQCALFGNRPFVWHIWDGQRDGFSALVNYHRLDRKTMELLTYSYLGKDWVERQRADARDEVPGADARLDAALRLQTKLMAILEGEKPYDIYVRWKDKHQQAIGWEPHLDDGVRLNIRPFVEAGVLRTPFNIHWSKDRGKNPNGSERDNDVHLTLAEKRAARTKAGMA